MFSSVRERPHQNHLWFVAGLVGWGLACGRTSGLRDAGVDQVRRSADDAAESTPDASRVDLPEILRAEDAALADVGRSGSERDAGEGPGNPDVGWDGPVRSLATCASWELAGPAMAVSKHPRPAVRVGDRYAVLSTPTTRADMFDTDVPHYAYDVTFSWFDPQTGTSSGSVMPFRFRGTSDAGALIDFGSANPAAIIATPQGFAIVWTAYRQSRYSLYFALLDATGNALGQPVTLDSQMYQVGDVVWDGSQFAVVWSAAQGPLRLGRLDSQGNLIGITEVVERTFLGPLRLFWDGSAYGVFWENDLPNLDEVWFARIARDGSVALPSVQLSNPDCYSGRMQVELAEDGYLVYWRENPRSSSCAPQSGLHRYDRNGQAQEPMIILDPQACEVILMARSQFGIGLTCAIGNGVGFAGLTDGGTSPLTPVQSVGLPAPTTGGIQVATARALFGDAEGFDVFWTGSLDGTSWGNYFTQIRCAK